VTNLSRWDFSCAISVTKNVDNQSGLNLKKAAVWAILRDFSRKKVLARGLLRRKLSGGQEDWHTEFEGIGE
jgi:hypothetical protein